MEWIYRDDDDRRFFLKVFAEMWQKTGLRVHAWVLMSNHYHLLVETPELNLVEGVKGLQNTTVSMEWINDLLKMKSVANVRQQIWRVKAGKSDLKKLSKDLKGWIFL